MTPYKGVSVKIRPDELQINKQTQHLLSLIQLKVYRILLFITEISLHNVIHLQVYNNYDMYTDVKGWKNNFVSEIFLLGDIIFLRRHASPLATGRVKGHMKIYRFNVMLSILQYLALFPTINIYLFGGGDTQSVI